MIKNDYDKDMAENIKAILLLDHTQESAESASVELARLISRSYDEGVRAGVEAYSKQVADTIISLHSNSGNAIH